MIDVSNVTISFEEENQTHVILDDISVKWIFAIRFATCS